ncbi:NADAR family protein [Crocosphaera sp.]|uniref:NADAR family protein n=1 Tax=Crocosphaera sp. TaxID=2729996 RepID=UPI003F23115B|nr:NADAR family protein [Crocosphaera sp.]
MNDPSQYRTYKRQECITFRKTSEPFGGLSNMAGGYPICINGIKILTSEALYQACRFPHIPDVQKLIISQKSPMTAKMKSKPYRHQSRPDWDNIRVTVMRWCLRVKLIQNWEKFGQLLLATEDKAIVEDSRKDSFWGAIPEDEITLTGMNVLGRLLMELREFLKKDPDSLKYIKPQNIKNFYLLNKPIGEIFFNIKNSSNKDKTLTSTLFTYQEDILRESKRKNKNNADDLSSQTLISESQKNQGKANYDQDKIIDSDDLFYTVLPRLEQQLNTEKTPKELAEIFNVRPVQIKDWLERAIEIDKVEIIYIKRRKKYISTASRENEPLLNLLDHQNNK